MNGTLEMIYRIQAEGVIGKYAIGGAVGATFYLEPVATADVDIFVMLPSASGGALLSEPVCAVIATKPGASGWWRFHFPRS